MKTILITPPHLELFSYATNSLAIPRLSAYLQKQGYQTLQINCSNRIYNQLLTKPEIENIFDLAEKQLLPRTEENDYCNKTNTFILNTLTTENHKNLLNLDFNKPNLLKEIIKKRSFFTKKISQAIIKLNKNFLKQEHETFLEQLVFWDLGNILINLLHSDHVLSTISYKNRYIGTTIPININNIFEYLDKKQNILNYFYKKFIVPEILQEKPGIIGITISSIEQFLPALLLLSVLIEKIPQAFRIVGGPFITLLKDFFLQKNELWSLFDGICIGQGEETLTELNKYLLGQQSIEEIPNFIHKNNSGKIIKNICRDFPMSKAATPEFTETRPMPIIPLQTSSGCYWNKCSFCDYKNSGIEAQGYNERPLHKVISDIRILKEKYHPVIFYFTDAAFHPKRLLSLANLIIKENLKIKYIARIKPEQSFIDEKFAQQLAKSGCTDIYLSLETGSNRINNLLNKGFTAQTVEKIIKIMNNQEIAISLYAMIGIPTETLSEIQETIKFILKNKKYIKGMLMLLPFIPMLHTDILTNYRKYDITEIFPLDFCQEFPLYYEFKSTKGLSTHQVMHLFIELHKIISQPDIRYFFLKKLSLNTK